jgi:glycosyltransferase involved in cell wall biosynthesis
MTKNDTSDVRADAYEISSPSCLASRPVVSVLMLAYNHSSYLAEAIEGVLQQRTSFPIELLIGEDHSPDSTREIATRFQCEHPNLIRIITSDQNVGMHANFRRIFEASRGEFVACCEGDDYWTSATKLERQVEVLRARPDVTAVYTDFAVSDFGGGRWSVRPTSALSGTHFEKLRGDLRGKAVAGALRTLTSVYRSSVVSRLYSRELPLADYPFLDGFLVLEAIVGGNVECLEGVSAVYRRSPNSATRSNASSNLRLVGAVRDFYENCEKFFPGGTRIDAAAMQLQNIAVCRAAYVAGDAAAYEDTYRRLEALGLPIPLYLSVLRRVVPLTRLRILSAKLRSILRGKFGGRFSRT